MYIRCSYSVECIMRPFKDISYLELWQPFYQAELNHLGNVGRGHYEEHFCEYILNLDQRFRRRCRLKIFLIYSSDGHLVRCSGTIWAITTEGILRNSSSVKGPLTVFM